MLITDFSQLAAIIEAKKLSNLYFFKPLSSFSIDSRKRKRRWAFIALKGTLKDGHDYIHEAVRNGACAIIAEHDIPRRPKVPFFIVKDTYAAAGALCRYIRTLKNPYIFAVTGSVGKTTTKEMLSFIESKHHKVLKNYKTENNILGVFKTFFALKDEDTMVLELGTNHPGELRELAQIVEPDMGIITFIKPVHLEGFGNLKSIYREKVSLLKGKKNIRVVLNRDDTFLRKVNCRKHIHWFSRFEAKGVYAKLLRAGQEECSFLINDTYEFTLKNPFDGFIYNALAAMAASCARGLSLKKAVERLNRFKDFPSGRAQLKKQKGFICINDAYNANPYAFEESLKIVDRFSIPKIAVIGDMLELGKDTVFYHKKIAAVIKGHKFDYVFAVGRFTPYVIGELKKQGMDTAFHFKNLSQIASAVRDKAKKGSLMFLKGSRKMELEKVLDLL